MGAGSVTTAESFGWQLEKMERSLLLAPFRLLLLVEEFCGFFKLLESLFFLSQHRPDLCHFLLLLVALFQDYVHWRFLHPWLAS